METIFSNTINGIGFELTPRLLNTIIFEHCYKLQKENKTPYLPSQLGDEVEFVS